MIQNHKPHQPDCKDSNISNYNSITRQTMAIAETEIDMQAILYA